MENPLDPKLFELKRLQVQRSDAKSTMGLIVDEKAPGRIVVLKVRDGSPADKCGFKVGDIPLAINGRTVVGKTDLAQGIADSEAASVVVVARRRPEPLEKPALPNGRERKPNNEYIVCRLRTAAGDLGVQWSMSEGAIMVKGITIGATGHQSGLQLGDRVLAINEEVVNDVEQFKDTMAAAMGAPIDLIIERPPSTRVTVARPEGKTGGPSAVKMVSSSLFLQTVKADVAGDPTYGIAPVPEDVQILADKWREEIVTKIAPVKEQSRKSLSKKTEDQHVQILSNISLRPLKNPDSKK